MGTQVDQARAELESVATAIKSNVLERDTEIEALLDALVARQHVLLIGPPGTAKSMLARQLCEAVGGKPFELLLSRYTAPDEVMGPISIEGLKQDALRRVTKGFLPEAKISFLDEIFKANSGMLNALLGVLNERAFRDDGEMKSIPLEMVVGASNEYPSEDALAPLYDRFLVRFEVRDLQGETARAKVMRGIAQTPVPTLNGALTTLREAAAAVDAPPAVCSTLIKVCDALGEKKIRVSDRRQRAIIDLMRARAARDGRAELSEDDVWVAQHCLWDRPEQRADVDAALSEHIGGWSREVRELRETVEELAERKSAVKQEINRMATRNATSVMAKVAPLIDQAKEIGKQIDAEIERYDGHEEANRALWIIKKRADVVRREVLSFVQDAVR